MHTAAAGYRLLQQLPVGGALTAQKLTALKSKRILFGHQSVGVNMVGGIADLYASFSVSPPNMLNSPANITNTTGGFFCEFYVGENYDPLGKISDFDANVRLYGSKLDIAFMMMYVANQFGVQLRPSESHRELAVTQQEIADSLGLTRETTSAELKKLELKRVISHSRKRLLRIKNHDFFSTALKTDTKA